MSAKPGSSHRHTKIIFTVGPATCEKEVLRSLVRTGVDVCRLNMAHASHDWTRETVARLREVCEEEQRHIAVMMDVKGPEIRTGFVDEPIELKEGQQLQLWMKSTFAPSPHPDVHRVDVNYRELGEDVNIGDVILVDSGLIRLEILEITVDCVVTKVVIGGELGSRRHINLPGVEVNLPSLTEKDLGDLAVGVEVGMDLVALSFVRNAEAVRELRNRLSAMGSLAKIVSKIEDQAGIRNLESIVKATDVVMVARGDLGVEIPFEELPMVQNEAVRICLTHGTPVIIATHMLESMVDSPFPTRAEITDIANAVR
ncbi:MAG: pyruvate kinase, partial [Verrucomicrobiota bacterium]